MVSWDNSSIDFLSARKMDGREFVHSLFVRDSKGGRNFVKRYNVRRVRFHTKSEANPLRCRFTIEVNRFTIEVNRFTVEVKNCNRVSEQLWIVNESPILVFDLPSIRHIV